VNSDLNVLCFGEDCRTDVLPGSPYKCKVKAQ
jgi:hypothetical protein